MDSTSPLSVLDRFVPIPEHAGPERGAIAGGKRCDWTSLQTIIARQLQECRRLDKEVLVDMAFDAWQTRPADCSDTEGGSECSPLPMLECVLHEHLNVCLSENQPAFVRRKSFVMLTQLLESMRSKLSLLNSQGEANPLTNPLQQPQHLSEEVSPAVAENSVETRCVSTMDIDPSCQEDEDTPQLQQMSEDSSLTDDVTGNSVETRCAPAMDIEPNDQENAVPQSVAAASSECITADNAMIADRATVPLHVQTEPNVAPPSRFVTTYVPGEGWKHGRYTPNAAMDRERQQQDEWVGNGIPSNSATQQYMPKNFEPPNADAPRPLAVALDYLKHYQSHPNFNRDYYMSGNVAMAQHYEYDTNSAQMYSMQSSLPVHHPTVGVSDGTGRGYYVPNAPTYGVSYPYVAPTPNYMIPQNEQMFIPAPPEKTITVMALEDPVPTYSNSINGRIQTLVTFRSDTSDIPVDNISILCRLNEWDPFWSNLSIGKIGVTRRIESTHPWSDMIATAGGFRLDTSALSQMAISRKRNASIHWVNDECAILLRMIPLSNRNDSKSRADCHLWPKGTFLQINGKPTSVIQRRQIKRDRNKWMGMSAALNIAPLIGDTSLQSTIEVFCCDDESYVFCASLSQYRSVDHVFSRLTNGENQDRIKVVPLDESKRRAISLAKSLVSIDVDDDDGCNAMDEQGKFIVSLKCPISRTVMQLPVRGRLCSHWQCFDLRNYLSINSFPSGNRWRCPCCELFVSVKQLEVCSLTMQFLEEFRSSVTWNRESVEFRSDSTYEFLAPRRLRRFKVAPEIATKLEANDMNPSEQFEIEDTE